jgi:hypothetical protein
MLAAEKKPSPRWGMPVTNMWWTHSPKLMMPRAITATTRAVYPTIGCPQSTGMIVERTPAAGRKMM